MTIRFSSEEDLETIKKMFLEEIIADKKLANRFAKDLVYKYKTFLFLVNKEIVGTISWDIKGGIEDGVVELVGLGVNQTYRRQGIGKNLVEAMIRECKTYFSELGYKLRVIFLYMERSNEIGELFYKSMYFNKICEISSFYPKNDAIIWIRYFER
jgi:ribosomal protein S18 acetylase RimI-like enzyme